jgi:nicotinate-nucleotide adenylyltransferase
MKLGILGGTFDPVHYGHLLMAEQCREQCELDEVWFLPTGSPPHKQGVHITNGEIRAEMLELAIAGHPVFSVSRREIEQEGTTYTFETLEKLHEEDPQRELYFLIGADSLADLPDWRTPARIIELATVVAVNRGDRPLPSLEPLQEKLGEAVAEKIQYVSMPGIDLSATDLRRRVKEGKSIRYTTPRAVEVYIEEHSLYRG